MWGWPRLLMHSWAAKVPGVTDTMAGLGLGAKAEQQIGSPPTTTITTTPPGIKG